MGKQSTFRGIAEQMMVDVIPTGFPNAVADVLPTVVEKVAQTLHPEKVILFGSYAYGQPTPDSDVDLLVVLDSDAPFVERYLAVSSLLRPRPFPLDLLVRTPDEIKDAWESGDSFIREIVSRGKVLYERRA
jgi:uncharacterized protein